MERNKTSNETNSRTHPTVGYPAKLLATIADFSLNNLCIYCPIIPIKLGIQGNKEFMKVHVKAESCYFNTLLHNRKLYICLGNECETQLLKYKHLILVYKISLVSCSYRC